MRLRAQIVGTDVVEYDLFNIVVRPDCSEAGVITAVGANNFSGNK